MSEHFIEICRGCDKVITQCRCPGPKETKYGFCPDCVKKRYYPMSDNALLHTYTEATIESLTAENKRLRALLNVADINPDSNPQDIRNEQIEQQRLWFEKEQEVERLRAALRPFALAPVVWADGTAVIQARFEYRHFEAAAEALGTANEG